MSCRAGHDFCSRPKDLSVLRGSRTMSKWSGFIRLVAAAGLAIFVSPAWAEYPEKPIRFVLPYAPGGIIDFVGRTLAQRLSEPMGQPVAAETQPGAAGTRRTGAAARACPDHYA